MLTVTNAGSFLGRKVPFLVSERIKSIYILITGTCASAILLLGWLGIRQTPGYVFFCAMYGFVSGVLATAPTAAAAHPVLSPSISKISARIGMSWATAVVGVLIGSPIASAMIDYETGSFTHGEAFAGVFMAAGAACLVLPLVKVIRYRATDV